MVIESGKNLPIDSEIMIFILEYLCDLLYIIWKRAIWRFQKYMTAKSDDRGRDYGHFLLKVVKMTIFDQIYWKCPWGTWLRSAWEQYFENINFQWKISNLSPSSGEHRKFENFSKIFSMTSYWRTVTNIVKNSKKRPLSVRTKSERSKPKCLWYP